MILPRTGLRFGPSNPLVSPRITAPLPSGEAINVISRFQDRNPQTGGPLVDGFFSPELHIDGRINGSQPFFLSQPIGVPNRTFPPGFPFGPWLDVSIVSGIFGYTVHNNLDASAPLGIIAFGLDFAHPFGVTGTPGGWMLNTDNLTYALWTAAPEVSSAQIRGGGQLGGFSIQSSTSAFESTSFILSTWDFSTGTVGPIHSDRTHTPSRF